MHRPLALGLALVSMIAAVLAGPVSAASPVVTVTAASPAPSPVKPTVTVTISINRSTQQISSCLYGVDEGPAISCGTGGADGSGTTFTFTLTNQTSGDHTVNAKVTLTDKGGATGSGSFTIVLLPPHVFARAWSNIDGVAGYQVETDVLIAELVDTNRDGVVSVGDTVHAGSFPTNIAATAFVPAGHPDHTVTGNIYTSSNLLGVNDGDDQFGWQTLYFADSYAEAVNGLQVTQLVDWLYSCSFGSVDSIELTPTSPSQPQVPERMVTGSCEDPADSAWIDVTIDLTP